MSSPITTSRVSYINTPLQSCYQLDMWWMFCSCSGYSMPWRFSHLLLVSLLNHLQPTKSIYMEPVQSLNLNCPHISGLEPEMPVAVPPYQNFVTRATWSPGFVHSCFKRWLTSIFVGGKKIVCINWSAKFGLNNKQPEFIFSIAIKNVNCFSWGKTRELLKSKAA